MMPNRMLRLLLGVTTLASLAVLERAIVGADNARGAPGAAVCVRF